MGGGAPVRFSPPSGPFGAISAAAKTAHSDSGAATWPDGPTIGSVGALAYSPDDSMIALGGTSGTVEILAPGVHYRRRHTLHGHTAPVLHLDWSSDGRFVQSCCARCELFFWDAHSGERVQDPTAIRDVLWESWSAPLGWPVQGIYPKMSDGSDINAAHRSPDGRLLVTSDDFRKVNLFRFPCGPGSAACRSTAAHAAHVSAVRFTADGKHVISLGGPDLCAMVWSVASAHDPR